MEYDVGTLLKRLGQQLDAAGVDSPRLSAQLLVGHVLGLDRLHVELASERVLTDDEAAHILALADRRARGEPLAYLLGIREFYGRDFAVNTHTLIPRPDTETVIDTILHQLPTDTTPLRFVDLGTGSGCIAITLACERPHWQGLMVEMDAQAAATAGANSRRHNVADRLACVRGDIFQLACKEHVFDVVVSNPPYVAQAEIADVMPEVLRYEPHTALFSPENGLSHLGACVREARRLLRPGGLVVLEHGYRQGQAVRELLVAAGFAEATTERDLAGLDRCTWGRLP